MGNLLVDELRRAARLSRMPGGLRGIGKILVDALAGDAAFEDGYYVDFAGWGAFGAGGGDHAFAGAELHFAGGEVRYADDEFADEVFRLVSFFDAREDVAGGVAAEAEG